MPDTGASIVLQPPEPGLFTRFQRKIDGLGIDHLLLVHKAITEPVYSELTTTYMLFAEKDQATAVLGTHVSRLVKVAVFPDWYAFLVQQGRQETLVQRCTCYGGADIWHITLDQSDWTRIIQDGLASGAIALTGSQR